MSLQEKFYSEIEKKVEDIDPLFCISFLYKKPEQFENNFNVLLEKHPYFKINKSTIDFIVQENSTEQSLYSTLSPELKRKFSILIFNSCEEQDINIVADFLFHNHCLEVLIKLNELDYAKMEKVSQHFLSTYKSSSDAVKQNLFDFYKETNFLFDWLSFPGKSSSFDLKVKELRTLKELGLIDLSNLKNGQSFLQCIDNAFNKVDEKDPYLYLKECEKRIFLFLDIYSDYINNYDFSELKKISSRTYLDLFKLLFDSKHISNETIVRYIGGNIEDYPLTLSTLIVEKESQALYGWSNILLHYMPSYSFNKNKTRDSLFNQINDENFHTTINNILKFNVKNNTYCDLVFNFISLNAHKHFVKENEILYFKSIDFLSRYNDKSLNSFSHNVSILKSAFPLDWILKDKERSYYFTHLLTISKEQDVIDEKNNFDSLREQKILKEIISCDQQRIKKRL